MLRHRWEHAVDAREDFVTDNRNWSGTDEDHQNWPWSGTDEDNHNRSGPDGSDSDHEPAYEEEPEEETEGSRGRQLLLEKSISCEEGQTHVDLRTVMAGLVNAVYRYEETRRLLKRSTGKRRRDRIKRVAHKLSALVLDESSASANLEEVATIWKEAGFKVKSEPKGTTVSVWYLVFIKQPSCKYSAAPKVVIAVRGTRMASLRDLVSDARVLAQRLPGDTRYKALLKVVEEEVELNGQEHVAITGHSLGAAFGLLVGKVMAGRGKKLEGHFFNPPFASFSWFNSDFLRRLEVDCKIILQTCLTVASLFDEEKSQKLYEWLQAAHTSFWSCSSWTPHLYLNEGDPISKGYLNFFGDQQFILDSINSKSSHPSFRTWWAEVCREVQPQTVLSLLRRKLQIPNHLFPSAIIMYSPGPQQTSRSIIKTAIRSHTVEQWLKKKPLPCHVILGGATS